MPAIGIRRDIGEAHPSNLHERIANKVEVINERRVATATPVEGTFSNDARLRIIDGTARRKTRPVQ